MNRREQSDAEAKRRLQLETGTRGEIGKGSCSPVVEEAVMSGGGEAMMMAGNS